MCADMRVKQYPVYFSSLGNLNMLLPNLVSSQTYAKEPLAHYIFVIDNGQKMYSEVFTSSQS